MGIIPPNNFLYLLIIIDILLGVSNLVSFGNALVLLALLLSLYVIFKNNTIEILYLMIALIPFYGSFNLYRIGVSFLIPLFASIKLIKTNISEEIPPYLMLSFGFLFIWLLHDMFYVSFGSLINILMMPLYFFLCVTYVNFEDYNGGYSSWIVIWSSLIAMITIFIVQGGDWESFLSINNDSPMRLGEANVEDGQKNQLGGAMGFPIYTVTILSLSIQKLILLRLNNTQKYFIIFLCVIISFVTFLTYSRVYLLGLASLFVFVLIYILQKSSIKLFIILFLIILLFVYIVSIMNQDIFDSIINTYNNRINYEFDDTHSRAFIWKDCLKYLESSIECILIGLGSFGYRNIGLQTGNLMSYSAHNLILDGIMSYGFLGVFFLFYIFYRLYKVEQERLSIQTNLLHFMPLLCILIMYMTSSPFTLVKVWPFMLFLTLNINHCVNDVNTDDIS